MPHNQYANYLCGSPKQRAGVAWGLNELTQTSFWGTVACREKIGTNCGKQCMIRTAGDISPRLTEPMYVCMYLVISRWDFFLHSSFCLHSREPHTIARGQLWQFMCLMLPVKLLFLLLLYQCLLWSERGIVWHFWFQLIWRHRDCSVYPPTNQEFSRTVAILYSGVERYAIRARNGSSIFTSKLLIVLTALSASPLLWEYLGLLVWWMNS